MVSSDIRVTEQPMFPYNFETIMKPKPDPLLPSEMSQEQFMESFPEKGVNLKTPVGYFNLNPARQEIFFRKFLTYRRR
jgi:hypothetical protein